VARAPAGARGRIRRLGPGFSLPFEDGSFDFVCSNQVIEHVEDLETTLDELARVTRRGGVGIHGFPVRETLVEPHLGVPLYHRVPEAARRPLARAWHGAGRANFAAEQPDFARWWADMAPFYDDCVFLRPAREVERAFARRFAVTSIEREKLSYHRGRGLPAVPGLHRLEHRRVGMAIEVRKR
jgi:SAM-dependent methyltransferase